MSMHVHARGDETRFERRFEHVAGHARVLADQHPATVGSQHARRGAGQAQREIHSHRVVADPAADAIGTEVFPCINSFSLLLTARSTRIASTVAATSCTRTICAPLRTAMTASATLPPAARPPSRPVSFATIDFRDSPTSYWHAERVEFWQICEQCQIVGQRLAEAEAGIEHMWSAGCPRPGRPHRAREKALHFSHDVFVVRLGLHGARLPCMCIRHTGTAFRGRFQRARYSAARARR